MFLALYLNLFGIMVLLGDSGHSVTEYDYDCRLRGLESFDVVLCHVCVAYC